MKPAVPLRPNGRMMRSAPRLRSVLGPCALASLARTRGAGKKVVPLAGPHCGHIALRATSHMRGTLYEMPPVLKSALLFIGLLLLFSIALVATGFVLLLWDPYALPLPLLLCVGAIYALRRRRIACIALVISTVCVSLYMGANLLLFGRLFEAGFDDGPFRGRPVSVSLAAVTVNESISYRFGKLHVGSIPSESSPLLIYTSGDDQVEWAFAMDVSSQMPNTQLREVRGLCVLPGLARDQLRFVGVWTYGAERGKAYIWKFGELQYFYLSW